MLNYSVAELRIKKCLAKHNLGVKNPTPGQIKSIPSSVLPKREDGDVKD